MDVIDSLSTDDLDRVQIALDLDLEIPIADQIEEMIDSGSLTELDILSIINESICHLQVEKWQSQKYRLFSLLRDGSVVEGLILGGELSSYTDPEGRITFGKSLDERSFSQFVPIVTDSVNFDKVYSEERNQIVPFTAIIDDSSVVNYPRYMFINVTLDEDYSNEQKELKENFAEYESLFKFTMKQNKPVIAIAILKNQSLAVAHGIAIICYTSGTDSNLELNLAYFDPLAYRRYRSTGGKKTLIGYDFAEKAFNENFEYEIPVNFIDLGKLCWHRNKEEFSCTQYIFDADYCYLYALHFLIEWIYYYKNSKGSNQSMSTETFQLAVNDTYVVNPEKLTRENNYESLVYRTIIMSFIISSLYCFLQNNTFSKAIKYLSLIKKYDIRFTERYGFSLLLR